MEKYTTLDDFLVALPEDKLLQVSALRKLILETEPQLQEHIKWNAPSYVLNGEDRITFNLMNKQGIVKLVLHMGATRKENKKASPVMYDDSGLIEWASDIRGIIAFSSMEDVSSNLTLLRKIVKNWLVIPAN